MKPGDYAFGEFGHNDQKQKAKASAPLPAIKRFEILYIRSQKERRHTDTGNIHAPSQFRQ